MVEREGEGEVEGDLVEVEVGPHDLGNIVEFDKLGSRILSRHCHDNLYRPCERRRREGGESEGGGWEQ